MVRIKAFKAVRPDEKFAKDVAALPYDVVKTEEAREIVRQNKHSFLKVDRAEINFDKKISPYETVVYLFINYKRRMECLTNESFHSSF